MNLLTNECYLSSSCCCCYFCICLLSLGCDDADDGSSWWRWSVFCVNFFLGYFGLDIKTFTFVVADVIVVVVVAFVFFIYKIEQTITIKNTFCYNYLGVRLCVSGGVVGCQFYALIEVVKMLQIIPILSIGPVKEER